MSKQIRDPFASYDSWLEAPYQRDQEDPPECPDCGEPGTPGEHCRTEDCDNYFPDESDLREEAEEHKAEAAMEARWDDDPGRDTW